MFENKKYCLNFIFIQKNLKKQIFYGFLRLNFNMREHN
jgi:hypothetical protein